jgi:hypothetical protein
MKQRKLRDVKLVIERDATRYQPDPHRRARVIPNKHKQYTRKARNGGSYDAI